MPTSRVALSAGRIDSCSSCITASVSSAHAHEHRVGQASLSSRDYGVDPKSHYQRMKELEFQECTTEPAPQFCMNVPLLINWDEPRE